MNVNFLVVFHHIIVSPSLAISTASCMLVPFTTIAEAAETPKAPAMNNIKKDKKDRNSYFSYLPHFYFTFWCHLSPVRNDSRNLAVRIHIDCPLVLDGFF